MGILNWAHSFKAVMGPEMIVILHPFFSNLPYLIQGIEDINIQHISSKGAVEPFYKSILRWLTRLNIRELDAMHLAPFLHE